MKKLSLAQLITPFGKVTVIRMVKELPILHHIPISAVKEVEKKKTAC